MADKKHVMIIGLEPSLIDFSDPFFAHSPGLNAAKIQDGLNTAAENLRREGYNVQICLTDLGETAAATVRSQLAQQRFDCIVIGAGIRTMPLHFLLFEKLINVAHEHAPQARLCFNTNPGDTVDAVKRWLWHAAH